MNALSRDVYRQFFGEGFAYNTSSTYPPFNAYRIGNDDIIIEMAVAGFSRDDISVEFDGSELRISGEGKKTPERDYLVHGLAARSFKRNLAVRGSYEIDEVSLFNGILGIKLRNTRQKMTPKIVDNAPSWHAVAAEKKEDLLLED